LRIDKYLWFARLAPSRARAQDLCESRRLRIDGRVVERASAQVRTGSVLSWARGTEIIVVRVEGLPDRRGPYVEARQFYTDLSPASAAACSPAQDALLPEALAVA
jgi:ribosome-associated heat shock protein Hsp15